jgi:alpha-amylase/alpha-mannosidase (GH57 family)
MAPIHHALVLNLHQPSGNLDQLLADNLWEAKEILYAYDRIPRSLWHQEDIARVHLSFSGTLLEDLSSPDFQSRTYGIVDCGAMLWHFQNRQLFEILGTGYYHPVLPLIPEEDRDEHLSRWLSSARHLFWRNDFGGFWPPEMAFSMELIPLLRRHGYRYVIVDSEHVEPLSDMRWEEVRYRPHLATHDGESIVVIVRDRELSDAQEAGMEYSWFLREVEERTRWCDFPPLVTTCTDGENGGWFRNTDPASNFWGCFYSELVEHSRSVGIVRPTFISDYLDRFGPYGEVTIRTGAWNTGWHHGRDFLQWTGSEAQRAALDRVKEISRLVRGERERALSLGLVGESDWRALDEAWWRLLRAETSCNFYWGEEWVHRCHQDLDAALEALKCTTLVRASRAD